VNVAIILLLWFTGIPIGKAMASNLWDAEQIRTSTPEHRHSVDVFIGLLWPFWMPVVAIFQILAVGGTILGIVAVAPGAIKRWWQGRK
jgi:hypothetical protein